MIRRNTTRLNGNFYSLEPAFLQCREHACSVLDASWVVLSGVTSRLTKLISSVIRGLVEAIQSIHESSNACSTNQAERAIPGGWMSPKLYHRAVVDWNGYAYLNPVQIEHKQ